MSTVTTIPVQHLDNGGTPAVSGFWTGNESHAMTELHRAVYQLRRPVYIFRDNGSFRLSQDGEARLGNDYRPENAKDLEAYIGPLCIRSLGDPAFCDDHGILYPYMTGAMANGIASADLVIAIARAGMLASFGAAGLTVNRVEDALLTLKSALKNLPYCINLIHSPNEKGKEDQLVDLFIKHDVHLVETSAYLALTPAVVRYRLHGIHRNSAGEIVTPNQIIAKASRVEVASRWLSPPPDNILTRLLDDGLINQEHYDLARTIPMAQDLTVEADSGGHTDNRPAITLLPTMIALRDRLQVTFNYPEPIRIGCAGGIATPGSAAAAFAMGAAYIVTGTINQACRESGSSDLVRKMLADAEQADIAMAPAVDMFEMGVKLQVLKRGTLFAMRGNKLYEAYRKYNSIEEIPTVEKEQLEMTIFKAPFADIWEQTKNFFTENDPAQLDKARHDEKHKMALMFRWYLGLSSRWANAGVEDRQTDFQVWCGPAMGAFNEWTHGSFLAKPENRDVVTVALNIIFGAAVATRLHSIRVQGIPLSADQTSINPLTRTDIENHLSER